MPDIFLAPKQNEKRKMRDYANESHVNIFSSFCQNPIGVSFQTQKPHEVIILFLRSHFATNSSWIIFTVILLTLPIIINLLLPLFRIDFFSSPTVVRFTTIYVLFYYLMVSAYAFISFLHWFYNVLIVSSERILDIDYSDIVVHNMAEAKLSHIEDVRYTQSGFIPSFVNYGNLFVQTAGTEENFEVRSIPKPREATDIITELTEKK